MTDDVTQDTETPVLFADEDSASGIAPTDYLPGDTYFGLQWHLKNTGQSGGTAGIDINVTSVWDDYRGAGVSIGIIDDGFDLTHADLAANFDTTKDYDYRRGDATPMYESGDAHGTTVAGVIGADDNGIGMVGVAPDAKMSGLRVSFSSDSTLAMFENALGAARNFDIVNNSWGFTSQFADDFTQSYMTNIKAAIEDAAINGRGGLGTNIVFSAGNGGTAGDNVNYHNMQNSIFTIAVGAIDRTGHIASFSNPGAAVLVSAPGVEIYTTDNTGSAGFVGGDYVGVGGTSFSAPIVTGIIALMLEANPTLGYRDVQEILAYSARKIDSASGGWQTNGADDWNGTGLHFSHSYGFGLVDAHAAVRLAESWGTGQGTYATLEGYTAYNYTTVAIPDGTSRAASTIHVDQDLKIDQVEVLLDIGHADASQLDVVLISPHGTQSLLYDNAASTDFPLFVFSTVANWGESSVGDWTIKVYDRTTGGTGTLYAWALNILGDTATPDHRYVMTDEFAGLSATAWTISDTDGGHDTLNAAALTHAITLDLAAGTGTTDGRGIVIASGTTIETVLTGDGNDTLTGSAHADTISTGRGNDMIYASAGADTIDGQAGTDTFVMTGGFHYTLSIAGDTDITLTDKSTATDITHLLNVENFMVDGTSYTLEGLLALAAAPTAGLTIIDGNGGHLVEGDSGNDTIYGNGGNDTIYGYGGDDTIYGGSGTDTVYAGDGNDTIYGEISTDYIYAGMGDDEIHGGTNNDRLHGEGGNDTIYGDDGADYLYGDDGNDMLSGGEGSDYLYGGNGNDTLIGGEGLDRFYCGSGNDTVVLEVMGDSMDRVYNFSASGGGADKLDISALLIGYDSGDPIANFLRLTVDGADTNIRVNADGIGTDFIAAARIYGVTLTGSAQSYIDSGLLIVEKPADA